MFSTVFICLLVCQQAYTKTADYISMKLGWRTSLSPDSTVLTSCVDPDKRDGSKNFSLVLPDRLFCDMFLNFSRNDDLDEKKSGLCLWMGMGTISCRAKYKSRYGWSKSRLEDLFYAYQDKNISFQVLVSEINEIISYLSLNLVRLVLKVQVSVFYQK